MDIERSSGDLKVAWIGGNCPVQAEGTICETPFYFRARGEAWSFSAGADPIGNPDFIYREVYPGGTFAAGWMEETEALDLVRKGAWMFLAKGQNKRITDAEELLINGASPLIELDPEICGGRPRIKGTRLEIRKIADQVDHSGLKVVLEDHDCLDQSQVLAALVVSVHFPERGCDEFLKVGVADRPVC
ncbi:DUF433 domain-containing protein [Pseudosulfitobacter pseudonitzschiae]|uniref:DUF433 domain-containing protein n=1 Tax=Pseudosulfitobacter pseudonitzschiae TaxID=1402135 RepID=UPI003B7B5F31